MRRPISPYASSFPSIILRRISLSLDGSAPLPLSLITISAPSSLARCVHCSIRSIRTFYTIRWRCFSQKHWFTLPLSLITISAPSSLAHPLTISRLYSFLYNSLEMLQSKALVHGDRDMADAISMLGSLYRVRVRKSDSITLKEEFSSLEMQRASS